MAAEPSSGRGRAVLDGAFALLRALRAAGGSADLSTVAREAGLPASTAHRLLRQLIEVGAVERRGDRYALGMGLLELSQGWEPTSGVRQAGRRALRDLARSVAGSALVLVRPGNAVVLERVDGAGARDVPDPGAHAGQIARALAHQRAVAVHGEPDGEHSCVAAGVPLPDGSVLAVAALVRKGTALEPLTAPLGRIAARIARRR